MEILLAEAAERLPSVLSCLAVFPAKYIILEKKSHILILLTIFTEIIKLEFGRGRSQQKR